MMRWGVGDEAGSADTGASGEDGGLGVVVAGDFSPRAVGRLMAEGQRGGDEFLHPFTADAVRRRGVVVALDPDEAMRLRHGAEAGLLAGWQPGGALRIVEAVTEGDHQARLITAQQRGEAVERGMGVPGRQELAAAGVGGALLQVQVGDREQAGGGPVQGAGGVEHKAFAGEVDGSGGHAWRSGSRPLPDPPPLCGTGGSATSSTPSPAKRGRVGRGSSRAKQRRLRRASAHRIPPVDRPDWRWLSLPGRLGDDRLGFGQQLLLARVAPNAFPADLQQHRNREG